MAAQPCSIASPLIDEDAIAPATAARSTINCTHGFGALRYSPDDQAAAHVLQGQLLAAWKRLPPEFRKQVMEHFEKLDHGGEDWVWRAVAELDLLPK
jgi:hypothetical protein